MAYEIYWYDQGAGILQVDIEGSNSWDRYHDVIDRIVEEVETTPLERIDVVCNSKGRMPQGNPIPHLQRTFRDLVGKEKMGLIVVVNSNRNPEIHTMRILVEVVLKTGGIVIPQKRLVVYTQEEALQLIIEDRAQKASARCANVQSG